MPRAPDRRSRAGKGDKPGTHELDGPLPDAERQRLDHALVARGLFESRARAQEAIGAGLVMVDGAVEMKPARMVAADANLVAAAPHPYVSRGGVKLAHALAQFRLAPKGLFCLDVGTSTGGFVDVLLRQGARHVVGIDTGRGQLHARLAGEPRLDSREGTDIRTLSLADLAEAPQLVTVDVSFISLRLVLPALARLAAPRADLVLLVKPQFEVGRAHLGKGGIVADAAARNEAVAGILHSVEDGGFQTAPPIESPIAGGDGNIEYFIHAHR